VFYCRSTCIGTNFEDVAHLLSRSGFGGTKDEINALLDLEWPDLVDRVFETDLNPPVTQGAPNLDPGTDWSSNYTDMCRFWIERAVNNPRPIDEKMVLFWHGHLVSGLSKVGVHQHMFDQLQLFRTSGLGDFLDLMQAISIDPAMLRYLDNGKSKATSPNENFARELMELFTLGVGNYTEEDVRSASRAWTGHMLVDGEYEFNSSHHDHNQKTFFGTTQNWDGPDIIHHILFGPKQQICAKYIATKLWSFFAYPNPSESLKTDLMNVFISSGLNIEALVREIFMRPEFRSPEAKNGLIKSPFEICVSILRHTGMSFDQMPPQWESKRMGQYLYNPPNVSGWRQNMYWISETTVWARSKLASRTRWRMYNDTDKFIDIRNYSNEDAVDLALGFYGIWNVSTATRNGLLSYVAAQRQNSWVSERSGLLYLPLMTPEFWMA